ncbi:MAG: EAL domain-containing protein [Gammaproteobacteria bacterium]|nr:EAL domain-containing protein [Gammaproteobacteria bacterium]
MFKLRRHSLMLKMLSSTVFIGLVIWAITDTIQNHSLKQIFSNKLAERFSWQAEKQRIMFDRYVKGHHQAVKLFVNSQTINQYVNSSAWQQSKETKTYSKPPPWLPKLSIIRNFFQPRYIVLLDSTETWRELYKTDTSPTPEEIKNPGKMLLNLSHNQIFLTRLNNKPFLFASAKINGSGKKDLATLILASPLDEEFLIASQGSALADSNVIALLAEEQPNILVSSNAALIPPGTSIEDLKDKYLTIGQGFFDYGATDIIIELVSFISTDEATLLTKEVLKEERLIRGLTALIYILSFMILIFFVTRRLQQFTNYVVNFSEQINSQKLDSKNTGDEITILEDNFNRLAELINDETQALTHQTLHDHLTELPNRKLLHNRIQQEILRGKRSSKQFILLLGDLNHFKEINDTLGHHIGDIILQQVAERLFKIFRKTDTVSRLGGDEFAILLPETNLQQAKALLRKVLEDFNHPFFVEGHNLHASISIGIAEYPTHGDDVNILLQRADVAMYLAKQNKLGYSIYDPNKDIHSIGRLALMSDLRTAIKDKKLELYFQPTIDVASEKIIGAEALLRWNHPQKGFIEPDEFIPLAEQSGLIKPLTQYVLEKAIPQCVKWNEQNFNLTVSVNLSVHDLHDKKLLTNITSLLSQYNLPAERLILEINEGDIMTEPLRARELLKKIRETGIQLSIDDFGTGYSSLSYIKKLPINEIKIDRSFVMEMASEDEDMIIVQATIQLAHNLGLKIVAEGVYNKETWERLKEFKCDIAQGYYISQPMNANEFTAWIMDKDRQNKSKLG